MPNYETPEPISVTLELGVGHVRIAASDRTDTVVEVRPSDPTDEADVKVAGQVRIDYANGTLRVAGPKARAFDFSRKTRSVDVTIELPTGSRVSAEMQVGDLRSSGRLGESRFKTSAGNLWLEQTGSLRVDTSAGHVSVDTIAGDADISTSSGKVQIGEVKGSVVVKNSNGETGIDAVTGDVRVRASNGDIRVDRAAAGVDLKTSNGSIRLGEVVRGSVVLGHLDGRPRYRHRRGDRRLAAGRHRVRPRAQPAGDHRSPRGVRGDRRGARAHLLRRHHDPPFLRRTMTSPTRQHSAPGIAVAGLRKSFDDRVVLDGLDLEVPPGTVFALLGANGAGKTTTVNILSTLMRAGAGVAEVAGHDVSREPDAVRAAIGVTGQFSAVDNLLTGEENLLLMADLHHLGRAERRRRTAELLEQFDLAGASRKPASTYSGGMRRRLDLAMTLVGEPQVIFLDEPSAGLDPRGRRDMWQVVRKLVAGGVTIFLTTQYLEEADALADRIAVLDHGRIVAEGTPEELKRRIPGGHVRLQFADPHDLDAAMGALDQAARESDALALQVPSDGSLRSLKALIERLDDRAIEVDELSVHTPDLDDVFLALTGNPSKEKVAPR